MPGHEDGARTGRALTRARDQVLQRSAVIRRPLERCATGGGDRGKEHAPKGNEPTTVVANDPEDRKGVLKNIGGSQSDHWNNTLASQAVQALWVKNSDTAERDRQLSATAAALRHRAEG